MLNLKIFGRTPPPLQTAPPTFAPWTCAWSSPSLLCNLWRTLIRHMLSWTTNDLVPKSNKTQDPYFKSLSSYLWSGSILSMTRQIFGEHEFVFFFFILYFFCLRQILKLMYFPTSCLESSVLSGSDAWLFCGYRKARPAVTRHSSTCRQVLISLLKKINTAEH